MKDRPWIVIDDGSRYFSTSEITQKKLDDNRITDNPPIECEFKVGDTVEFTNDYGVSFSPRRVIGFSETPLGDKFIHINDDSWWFPARPSSLKKIESK